MSLNKLGRVAEGFLKGNHKVISDFYAKNLPIISKYVQKNSGSRADAEDVFHDALAIIFEKLKTDSFQLSSSLSTYVYAVSRNIWMNRLRRRNKILSKNKFLNKVDDNSESVLDTIDNSQKQRLFQKYFMKLEPDCQSILLHFFNGNSMKEISGLMKYSEGYSRKKKFECKRKLIEMIESDPMFQELIFESKKKIK